MISFYYFFIHPDPIIINIIEAGMIGWVFGGIDFSSLLRKKYFFYKTNDAEALSLFVSALYDNSNVSMGETCYIFYMYGIFFVIGRARLVA